MIGNTETCKCKNVGCFRRCCLMIRSISVSARCGLLRVVRWRDLDDVLRTKCPDRSEKECQESRMM